MAVTLKEMRPFTEAALRDMLEDMEQKARTTWAVYADYYHEDMTWRITKIVPWLSRDPKGTDFNVFKMTDCRDEIDAYKKFMEQTK